MMKQETAADLKKLLEKTNSEISKVAKERADLQAKESKLRETAKALHVLLSSVSKESMPETPASVTPQVSSAHLVPISQFISNFIAQRNGAGTTHKEIAEALKGANYLHHRNYPYVVVSQLRTDKKVVERDGRLFWEGGA